MVMGKERYADIALGSWVMYTIHKAEQNSDKGVSTILTNISLKYERIHIWYSY